MKDHHMRTARPIWLNFFRCVAPVFIYKDQHEGFIYTYQHNFYVQFEIAVRSYTYA